MKKDTIYEIREFTPSVLKQGPYPLQLIMILAYKIFLPLIVLKAFLERPLDFLSRLFKKKEVFSGKDEFFHYEECKDDTEKTVSTYYSKRESEQLLKKLVKSGIEVDLTTLSLPFIIKKREEFGNDKKGEVKIIFSCPPIANKISKKVLSCARNCFGL